MNRPRRSIGRTRNIQPFSRFGPISYKKKKPSKERKKRTVQMERERSNFRRFFPLSLAESEEKKMIESSELVFIWNGRVSEGISTFNSRTTTDRTLSQKVGSFSSTPSYFSSGFA
ncbi:hypothetical protein AVEN_47867-1 [Araneus ventricosus]|uniref:Uncharacterized protein n=1 Tax=Araneus ventricosus TaxID=182803 RepID=A0A4Y2C4D2_ARAVE|nr:hypothetical protein AVEN_47867-1 [Araneus ventricosus]